MGSSLLQQSVPSRLQFFLVCSAICVSVHAQASTLEITTPTLPSTAFILPECPNLSPCTCYTEDDYLRVECREVPMEEIRIAFSKISPPIEIDYLKICVRPPPGDSIPADLLGQSRVRNYLEISGPCSSPSDRPSLLIVDPNAFRSSNNSLQSISFWSGFDSRMLDFGFLAGFIHLSELRFNDVTDLYRILPNLPALPALTSLRFFVEPSLNTAFATGGSVLQCDGLTKLYIDYCDIDDFGLAQLLDWIKPSSAKTLREISIKNLKIKSVPLQMASFQALKFIEFYMNAERLEIPSNSFYFIGQDTGDNRTAPSISLRYVGLNYVGPGAFQGDYSFTQVDLFYNELTRFEEAAFKSMLQDMSTTGTAGFLDVYPSLGGFDCYTDSCHLAWLLRDNRDLLGSLKNSRCTDGTSLADLPSNLFENCTKYSI